MTLYKLEEWQSGSGYWLCEHTSSHPKGVQKWILPARLLGLPADEFIKWLVKNYEPEIFYSDSCDFVGWKWKNQEKMRKYKNTINAIAREKNFMI